MFKLSLLSTSLYYEILRNVTLTNWPAIHDQSTGSTGLAPELDTGPT